MFRKTTVTVVVLAIMVLLCLVSVLVHQMLIAHLPKDVQDMMAEIESFSDLAEQKIALATKACDKPVAAERATSCQTRFEEAQLGFLTLQRLTLKHEQSIGSHANLSYVQKCGFNILLASNLYTIRLKYQEATELARGYGQRTTFAGHPPARLFLYSL